jgi:hypothetical protein
MRQLSLFDERLQQERDQALAENAWLKERLEHAKVAYRKLRDQHAQGPCRECQAWRLRVDDLNKKLTRVTWDAQFWKDKYAQQLMASMTSPRATPVPTVEPVLRKLLVVAHPDRWSQGQDASQLAHELAVVINQLRAEVQG